MKTPLSARTLLALAVGVAVGVSLSLSAGVLAERERVRPDLPAADAALLSEVLARVKRDYVEKVNDHQLMENAVRGMVASLDPHSAFLDATEYEDIQIATSGNYSGVGIEVELEQGAVRVVAPIEGSPADLAGIQPGDIVLSIDGHAVNTASLSETISRMRGQPGTPVRLTVEREQVEEPIEFKLLRAHVEVRSVRAEMLVPDYGYVRITHFSETTAKDLKSAVAGLRAPGQAPLRGLVLDLRNNPGGVLEAGVDVADAFLNEGVIVTADGRARDSRFEMDATRGDLIDGARLVVLVNGGSASASEIVAGALRDQGRATLIGRTTFGKGSVQTVSPLSQGRGIKLTTSRYFTPSGTSINETGITPDIVLARDDVQKTAVAVNRALPVLQRDKEVQAALELLRKEPTTQLAHRLSARYPSHP